jgi:hypothetical protein
LEAADNGLDWAEAKVLEAIRLLGPDGGGLGRIDDVLAQTGKPFRHSKLEAILDHLIEAELVDGAAGLWWATVPDSARTS